MEVITNLRVLHMEVINSLLHLLMEVINSHNPTINNSSLLLLLSLHHQP